ncbi:hypothetical protein J3E68DRAFT_400538 [Trichoderma sp. SZMC 28012]
MQSNEPQASKSDEEAIAPTRSRCSSSLSGHKMPFACIWCHHFRANHRSLRSISRSPLAVVRRFNPSDETWWHFEGRIPNTTLECVRRLRDKLPNAQISVEVEKPGRDGLRELAAEANVVFYSRSWAESCGHGSAESCLVDEQRRREASSTSRSLALLVCTWGADGASMCQSSEQIVHCPVESRAKSISVVE